MTVKKYNHVHKLRRDRYSTGRAFYYCTNGDCLFKVDVKHSLGKTTLCNKCGKAFEMNEYSIRAAKPICLDCVKRKNSSVNLDKIGVDIADFMDRESKPIKPESKFGESVNELEKAFNNILVKPYNPEDEDDAL